MANYRGFEGTSNFFAANAPTGVVLDYWAKTGGPVRVTVTDKSGKQVRQVNTRAVAGAINRAIWDMRYDSPIPPAAGGGRGGRGGGGRGGARWNWPPAKSPTNSAPPAPLKPAAVAEVAAVAVDASAALAAAPSSIPASTPSPSPSPAKPKRRKSPSKTIRASRCPTKFAPAGARPSIPWSP